MYRTPDQRGEQVQPQGMQKVMEYLRDYKVSMQHIISNGYVLPGAYIDEVKKLQEKVNAMLSPKVEIRVEETVNWPCLCGRPLTFTEKRPHWHADQLVLCEECEAAWLITWDKGGSLSYPATKVEVVWQHAALPQKIADLRAKKAIALQDQIKQQIQHEQREKEREEDDDDNYDDDDEDYNYK